MQLELALLHLDPQMLNLLVNLLLPRLPVLALQPEQQQLLEQLRRQRSENPRHGWLRSAAL